MTLRSAVLLAAAAITATAACSGGHAGSGPDTPSSSAPATTTRSAPATGASPAGPSSASWTTYGGDGARSSAGAAPAGSTLGVRWRAGLDAAVYAQPLLDGGHVYAVTERNSVYRLDSRTGRIDWQVNLGPPQPLADLPCGNIDPLGSTGTPVLDPASHTLYVASELRGASHVLVALDAGTGRERWRVGLDVTTRDRHAEQQRAALLLANSTVYVAFGGLDGDCGNYIGYVVGVPTSGQGPVRHYEVPSAREAGIWGASGPVVLDARASGPKDVYVAVGNGASFGGRYDGSDSVLRLAPDLSRRIDFFAPRNWGSENAADADLGSMGPLPVAADRILIAGKTGDVYLLDAGRLGGIGGQLARAGGCHAFGGGAYDASAHAAFLPCTSGLRRFDVGRSSVRGGWQVTVAGSPSVGGGRVWSLDTGGGVLHAFDETTGRSRGSVSVGEASRFAAPVLAGDQVLVGTLGGVVAVTAS